MVMVSCAPLSYRNISKIPCSITKGNSIYDTICLSPASMDLLRRIGMKMDMWGHRHLNSALKQPEILLYISRMMLSRKILHSMVNTRKPINCLMLSCRNIFRRPILLEIITSMSRLSQKWGILRRRQWKLLISI